MTLEEDLRRWAEQELDDWDDLVDAESDEEDDSDLWGGMPVIDSKAVARTSHIFKKHLGIPLDVKHIRPGGYKDIDDMIQDIVPKMQKAADEKASSKGKVKAK